MNRDILEGKWMQVRGQVKQQWGKLSDNELDMINGRYDVLVGLVQEVYGYNIQKAEQEVDSFLQGLSN
jgi:uncharacterized protein YjbJ (UPF0337 family)